MKTAMQELIDEMYLIKNELLKEGLISRSAMIGDMIRKAADKLEKEKEQIIDLHVMLMKNGLEQEGNAIEWDYNELKEEALKFYNQKYNQNK